MPGPYSQDLRDRVASAIAGGSSACAAARRFRISESTAVRWAQRLNAEVEKWKRVARDSNIKIE